MFYRMLPSSPDDWAGYYYKDTCSTNQSKTSHQPIPIHHPKPSHLQELELSHVIHHHAHPTIPHIPTSMTNLVA